MPKNDRASRCWRVLVGVGRCWWYDIYLPLSLSESSTKLGGWLLSDDSTRNWSGGQTLILKGRKWAGWRATHGSLVSHEKAGPAGGEDEKPVGCTGELVHGIRL